MSASDPPDTTYSLWISADDWRTIAFVGRRYAWSEALIDRAGLLERRADDDGPGWDSFPEHIAWELSEAFEADTEGGHSMFPMLDPRSRLAQKLIEFHESIV